MLSHLPHPSARMKSLLSTNIHIKIWKVKTQIYGYHVIMVPSAIIIPRTKARLGVAYAEYSFQGLSIMASIHTEDRDDVTQ